MVEKNNVRHICIIGCVRICSATTPHPSSPEEGTTLGARPCSGRHGGLPLRLDADYAGCCLPLAGASFRFTSLPLRRQRSSGSPHQARMAIGPSSKGLLHHLPVFWSGLRPSLHPSFFFNFRNFGRRLIEKASREIALAGVGQQDDDGLAAILRLAGQMQGSGIGGTRGDAHEQAFGTGQ